MSHRERELWESGEDVIVLPYPSNNNDLLTYACSIIVNH